MHQTELENGCCGQLRQLLQHQPDLLRKVHGDIQGQRDSAAGTTQQRHLASDQAISLLRSHAKAAEKSRKSDEAMALWQQVLEIIPTDYQASRAGECRELRYHDSIAPRPTRDTRRRRRRPQHNNTLSRPAAPFFSCG